MKVGNKLLNRIVSVGMLAVVLFGGFWTLGVTNSYAYDDGNYSLNAINSVDDDFTDGSGKHVNVKFVIKGESPVYLIRIDDVFYLVSKENFIVNCVCTLDDGSSYSERGEIVSLLNCNHYTFYRSQISISNLSMPRICYCSTYDKLYPYCKNNPSVYDKYPTHFLGGFLFDVSITRIFDEQSNKPVEGSQDNPIHKDDFGYPQIYNSTYIHNDPNNLETLDKLYSGQDFQWKKKTTTGFDLTNNDYNYTYIECKVKANYQYNDKFSGKGSWHDFSSYGEMGNLGKVRAESLSHYYTFQEFQEALPKTSNELPDHKMRAIKSSAVYYFRVVCMKTSSTVVIPDEKDCKYYCGPWRSITVTKINGKDGTSIVEDGDMDENGEWKKDDSSNDNGKDIDNGSAEGDDLSDASDKAHETINSNANKSTLDLDSAKAFINQVADVPKMIADIFSFLPDWVKYSFAFGFALIPILIIFKLIRG